MQRLLALSGVVFAVLFLVGWFASGGDAPDYGATDQDWTDWAEDNQWKSRVGAFAMLLAGFVFLTSRPRFAASSRVTIYRDRGSAQLARVAFAGAITGMAGMVMAIVIIARRDYRGCRREPDRDSGRGECFGRAIPSLCHGFCKHSSWLPGSLTLGSGVFARWTGVVALIGAVSFLDHVRSQSSSGLGEDSLFGFGFFPGVLALVIWSIATSLRESEV